jgi:hypothetical protein
LKQAAAERIDCADFDHPYVGHRSAASNAAPASATAAADEIDRLNRSVKQHVEKIRSSLLSLLLLLLLLLLPGHSYQPLNRTLEMNLTKSNQEAAMLKLQNGALHTTRSLWLCFLLVTLVQAVASTRKSWSN